MKSESGPKMLSPDVLFRVESGEVPPNIRAVSDFQRWRTAEDQAMLDECARLFREQLQLAFLQFERDVNNESQH